MPARARIETAIEVALGRHRRGRYPGRLADALDHAVLPGGARIRPMICLAVARACGDDQPLLSDAAAASIELIHCASLVHDDLPSFDDADLRRGKAAVHKVYGEALAVLAGDTLIIQSFDALAEAAHVDLARGIELIRALSRYTGMPYGICAGQAWESEKTVDLHAYHMAKTGALFMAATCMGAVAAGEEPEPWVELGARIGEAFQVADDLRDAIMTQDQLGKPVGQDEAHGRPSAVAQYGVEGATRRLDDILGGAIASIPSCPGEAQLCEMVRAQAQMIMPVSLVERVS
mgnify:CR=1 FL=1